MYAPFYRLKHTLFLKECERIKLISVQINRELSYLLALVRFTYTKAPAKNKTSFTGAL